MSEEGTNELVELAAEAYVYGCPLVLDLSMVDTCVHEGFGPVAAAPFNRFSHSTRLGDAGTRFASVNNDTAYSLAQLDLSSGPLRLHVPDTGGAYYVVQFVDAWTNNFAYVGSRATGTEAGDWLIVPPGWAGTSPADVRGVIDAPTSVVTLVGRNACDGPEDLERRVRPLQERFTLTPLKGSEHGSGLPAPDAGVPAELGFFERLRVWMADFPPSAADRAHQDRFQPLGLLEEGPSPYAAAVPALVGALKEGLARGRERVEAAGVPGAGGGGKWMMNPHLFDYNLDWFGVGTIDSPEWKIADRKDAYLARAVAARVGLWGNHGYEAVYAQAFRDSDGEPLSGAHRYELRFEELPPVDAFWSLTMYDVPDSYLVGNPAGRYSIGDRTPGIVHADDGSLTIHISRERPADPAAAANWLPAPEGNFRPAFRLYMPKTPVLDGQYELPVIRRVGAAGQG
ncbi:DUF1254 domain-containing protein [Streptomyces sp. A0642]|uniref:DUF1254 domain-containing protein n=1 Tax=Streptomyces sp. A0642 TaxID=2563100 RepID=UPI001F0E9493|nr:DUF1254 domain-containing protein [Streptomyces sp. A0642]